MSNSEQQSESESLTREDVVEMFEPGRIDEWREDMVSFVHNEEPAVAYIDAIIDEYETVIQVNRGLDNMREGSFVPPEVVRVVLSEYDVSREDLEGFADHVSVAIALSIPKHITGLEAESEYLETEYDMNTNTIRGLRGAAINSSYSSIREALIDGGSMELLVSRDELGV